MVLDYDNAYNLLLEAAKFEQEKEAIASVMVEPAFYYIYTGNLSKAWALIQKIASLTGNGSTPQRKLTRAHLLSQLKGLKAKELENMEKKYFPISGRSIPVQGGRYQRIQWDKGGNPVDTNPIEVASFLIAETEITIWQYNLFDPKHKEKIISGPKEGDYPCSFISWNDAIRYCNWLSVQRGITPVYQFEVDGDDLRNVKMVGTAGYRLPCAYEWEWAAYGGKKWYQKGVTTYAGEGSLDKLGWYNRNSGGDNGTLHRPKQKNKNAIGVFDMSGNLKEWCWDEADKGRQRINKGGSYNNLDIKCEVVHQDSFIKTIQNGYIGVRLIRAISKK